MKTEYTERDSLISQQDARIKELEVMVALQADALKAVDDSSDECEGDDGELVFTVSADAIHSVRDVISATAETVQAFREAELRDKLASIESAAEKEFTRLFTQPPITSDIDEEREKHRLNLISLSNAYEKTSTALYKMERENAELRKLLEASKVPEGVLADVANERLRQHGKWDGVFDDKEYTALDWHEMIADYNGWARRMACMGSYDKARNRYVKIAALAVAAVEALDANLSEQPPKEPTP